MYSEDVFAIKIRTDNTKPDRLFSWDGQQPKLWKFNVPEIDKTVTMLEANGIVAEVVQMTLTEKVLDVT